MVFLIQNLRDADPEVLSFHLAWLASNTLVIKEFHGVSVTMLPEILLTQTWGLSKSMNLWFPAAELRLPPEHRSPAGPSWESWTRREAPLSKPSATGLLPHSLHN